MFARSSACSASPLHSCPPFRFQAAGDLSAASFPSFSAALLAAPNHLQDGLGNRILVEAAHFSELVLRAMGNEAIRHAEPPDFDAGDSFVGEKLDDRAAETA